MSFWDRCQGSGKRPACPSIDVIRDKDSDSEGYFAMSRPSKLIGINCYADGICNCLLVTLAVNNDLNETAG